MADDEGWGDDAGDGGWGDDSNANAGGDGGWGDAEANDDWGAAQEDTDMTAAGGDDDKELSVPMQIENAYYEADDNRLERNMAAALEQFEKVLELGTANMSELTDESLLFVFKSVRNIVSIHLQAGALEKMTKAYKSLLTLIPKVTRNEAQEAVSAVLHDLGEVDNKKFVQEMYKLTAETVQVLPDQERLWFRVSMKYCEYAFANGEYKEAEKKLEELLRSCRTADGRDDLNKGSELLEIYALESRISAAEKDSVKLQALYEKTKNLNAAVKDPRSLSVIRECWGEMFAEQGDWNRAYQEFYLAFTAYQEIGNSGKAKQCLKYVVIANMLSGGTSNPFDSREAKAFQSEKDIEAIGLLRQAYEKCDVARFNSLLATITSADQFISKHLSSMVRDFQSRAILQLIKSYRRVRLDYLAELLQVDPANVEALLVPLILDGHIVGKIDQARGLLDLSQSVGGGQKYLAIDKWTAALVHLRQNLPTPYQSNR